jgi:transposase
MVQFIDPCTRAVVVYLKSLFRGKTTAEIASQLELTPQTINDIYARAIKRGFDPNQKPFIMKSKYVQDAPRSGRPTKQTEPTKQALVSQVCSN